MKKTKILALAFAALALGACSNDDIVDQQGGSTVNPGEQGYVSVALNLPTQPSTRVNDNFDQGTEAEYAVNNAALLVFSGASEDAAVFTGAYPLTLGGDNYVGGNITTTYQVTQKITKPLNPGDDIYALVMTNYDKVLTGNATEGWQILGNALTANTTTVAQVKAMQGTATADDLTANGIFMTNAPLYSVPGSVAAPTGGSVSTLTKINAENVFTTEDEAKANPAASVYVERGVAKVSVNVETASDDDLEYTFAGWGLDITNTRTYAVRNVVGADWWELASKLNPTADPYRFVGANPVAAGLYRTYFGYDPNYDGQGYTVVGEANSPFATIIGSAPTLSNGNGASVYCLENTFNVANQNDDQTTRVIVAASLAMTGAEDNGDFYTINNNKDEILTAAKVKDAVFAQYLIAPEIVEILTDVDGGLKEDQTLAPADVTVDFGDLSEGGYISVANITVNESAASKFKGDAVPLSLRSRVPDAVLNNINADTKIAYYKGGVSYYPVMIQHFGDDQTPWTPGEVSYPTTDQAANYLGRWGVLRNNWYEINVTGIKSIGSPEVPEVYGTPDDPVESWISVEINVLSWAKRVQNAGL